MKSLDRNILGPIAINGATARFFDSENAETTACMGHRLLIEEMARYFG
ncbi:MAG: hypothetical protein VYA34_03535 [Myxococcota bacterium]|nr:hypothetical protein [Myxococcota bacterium]